MRVGRSADDLDAPDGPDDATVVRHVRAWAAGLNVDVPSREVRDDFVRVEFEGRLKQYHDNGRFWRAAQVGGWLLTAGLGVLGSALAVSDSYTVAAVIAGSLVAILTTFTHAAHPGAKADGYDEARLTIRDDAWDLVNRTGDYKDLSEAQQYEAFVKRLRETVTKKRLATRLSLE